MMLVSQSPRVRFFQHTEEIWSKVFWAMICNKKLVVSDWWLKKGGLRCGWYTVGPGTFPGHMHHGASEN